MKSSYSENTYWEDANYVVWDRGLFSNSVLSNRDLCALCDVGIPSWVAPNMHFAVFECDGRVLKLGEDREDRGIYLSLDTGLITVGENQFMNSNAELLRKSLQLYAVLVEKALEKNSFAIINNKIDQRLVNEFHEEVSNVDTMALSSGSFWHDEITRISG